MGTPPNHEPPIHLGYFAVNLKRKLNETVSRRFGFKYLAKRENDSVYFNSTTRKCHVDFTFSEGRYYAELFIGAENISSLIKLQTEFNGKGKMTKDGLAELADDLVEHLFNKQ